MYSNNICLQNLKQVFFYVHKYIVSFSHLKRAGGGGGQAVEDECSGGVKEAQFNTMYYIAKEVQALNHYSKCMSIQIENKCPDLHDNKKLYSRDEAECQNSACYQRHFLKKNLIVTLPILSLLD